MFITHYNVISDYDNFSGDKKMKMRKLKMMMMMMLMRGDDNVVHTDGCIIPGINIFETFIEVFMLSHLAHCSILALSRVCGT